MKPLFNNYPTLTSAMIDDVEYICGDYSASFLASNVKKDLALKDKGNNENNWSALLVDESGEWHPEIYNLVLNKTISFGNPKALFDVNGIADVNDKIGIAVQWISTKSEQRGTENIATLDHTSKGMKKNIELRFPKNTIRGSIKLNTILYLSSVSKEHNINSPFCSIEGTVLGILDTCEIYTDGNGSMFPIATIEDIKGPLWSVFYDKNCDPLTDSFSSDYVEIRINSKHKDYPNLNVESNYKDSPLFIELLGAAMFVIVQSAKESIGDEWNNVISSKTEFDQGSIAAAMNYFFEKLQWDASSPSDLSYSIKKYFEDTLSGGGV